MSFLDLIVSGFISRYFLGSKAVFFCVLGKNIVLAL